MNNMLESCKNKYYDLLESIQDLLLHIYLNQISIINNKELIAIFYLDSTNA